MILQRILYILIFKDVIEACFYFDIVVLIKCYFCLTLQHKIMCFTSLTTYFMIIYVVVLTKDILHQRNIHEYKFSPIGKTPTLYSDPLSNKMVYYLTCREGKGVVETFTVVHKMPRYLLIYYKISFVLTHFFY